MMLSHDEKYCCPSAPPRAGQADFCLVTDNADAMNRDSVFTHAMTDPR